MAYALKSDPTRSVAVPGLRLGGGGALFLGFHIHCDYTDVGNGALRTSSMADTLTGSCLFVPISSPMQQFLA